MPNSVRDSIRDSIRKLDMEIIEAEWGTATREIATRYNTGTITRREYEALIQLAYSRYESRMNSATDSSTD